MGNHNKNSTYINPIRFKPLLASSNRRLLSIANFSCSNSIPWKSQLYHFEVHWQVPLQTELFSYLHEYSSDWTQINCNASSNVSTWMPDVFRDFNPRSTNVKYEFVLFCTLYLVYLGGTKHLNIVHVQSFSYQLHSLRLLI